MSQPSSSPQSPNVRPSRSHATKPAGITRVTAWQNFGLSILFIVLMPLLPVILEWMIKSSLAEGSLLITASIYAAAIAIASNNRFAFGVGLVIAILEAALYGTVAASDAGSGAVAKTTALIVLITNEHPSELRFAPQALWVILILVAFSVFERFRRHIQSREEFFEFMKGGMHV